MVQLGEVCPDMEPKKPEAQRGKGGVMLPPKQKDPGGAGQMMHASRRMLRSL